MTYQYLEHCIYCGSEVLLTGEETLVKCTRCGRTLVAAEFESRIAAMQAASEKEETLKQELESIRKAKEAADERLFSALSTLDRMDRAGEDASKTLAGMEADIMKLYREQKSLTEKADALQRKAEETNEALTQFQSRQEQEKLQELRQLLQQAENFRQDWEFDKAAEYYRKVLVKGEDDIEVYWRLMLCHYCISYQNDGPDTWVPVLLNPDLKAPGELSVRRDLKRKLDQTEPEKREVYLRELGKIDEILDRYRKVRHEAEYDVFISVKQNRDGHVTTDSDIASDLYDRLTEMGLKVFNSRRSRALFAGKVYEPYIISALMSAKVMIVVGTSRENMESRWVKNEWSRFRWIQQRENQAGQQRGRLLLCYLAMGMDPYDLPAGLNPDRQAVKDGINSERELKAALRELLEEKQRTAGRGGTFGPGSREDGSGVSAAGTASVKTPEDILRQMQAQLYLGKFEDVKKAYQALAESGSPSLSMLSLHECAICAEQQVTELSSVIRSEADLGKNSAFLLARRFCQSPADQQKLQELLSQNRQWRAEKRRQADHKDVPAKILVFARGNKLQEAIDAGADYVSDEETLRRIREEGWADFDVSIATPDVMGTVGSLAKILAPMGLMPSPRNGTITMDVAGAIREIRTGKRKIKMRTWQDEHSFVLAEDWCREGLSALFSVDMENSENTGRTEDKEDAGDTGNTWETKYIEKVGRAAGLLEKAADLGSPEGQYCLGVMYYAGADGLRLNENMADRWLSRAREDRNREKEDPNRVKENHNKLKDLFEKAQEAAADGNRFAQYLTGYMYFYGDGTDQNREEAFRWMSLAADAGDAAAQDFAGVAYEYGEGIRYNPFEAMKLYRKAAEAGNERARYHAGMLYVKEFSPFSKDLGKALRLIRQAAENRYPRAQNQMGIFCQKGEGVPKNYEEAFQWYTEAAGNGDVLAKNNLGNCYLKGIGTAPDKKKAAESFFEPARQGRASAQFRLAQLYEAGEGVEQDLEEAERLYKLAAEQNYKPAVEKMSQRDVHR